MCVCLSLAFNSEKGGRGFPNTTRVKNKTKQNKHKNKLCERYGGKEM